MYCQKKSSSYYKCCWSFYFSWLLLLLRAPFEAGEVVPETPTLPKQTIRHSPPLYTAIARCAEAWKLVSFFPFLIQLPLSVWRYDQVHHHGMLSRSKGNGNVHHYAHLYNSTRLTPLSDDSLFTPSSAVAFRTNFFSQDRNLTVTGLNAL